MKSSLIHDREFFECLVRHEGVKRLKASFGPLLGPATWWITYKVTDGPKSVKSLADCTCSVWADSAVKRFLHTRQLLSLLRRRQKETKAFRLDLPSGPCYCVPLVTGDRVVGHLGIAEARRARPEALEAFSGYVSALLEACTKSEELKRLSATIRPRAIALSTVHTVHRIINSTLNLDELISRLAHLTAQVLRSNRCAIWLVEKPKLTDDIDDQGRVLRRPAARTGLVCKAQVGYPKQKKGREQRLPIGRGLEGMIAKTARIVLRRRLIGIPLIDEDVIGVITVSLKKDGKEFTHFDQEILTTLSEEAVIAIKNAQLYEEQKKVTLGTIQSLAVILGTKVNSLIAPATFLRVALRIAEEIHLGEEETQALHYATLLKDTAKIGIPDDILSKPTKLTGEEYQLIRDHPIKGAKIVQSFESLKPVVPIILYSREKFDGSGYPKGLKGESIPVGARVLSVINAFEAIVIGRPYRSRAGIEEAIEEIVKNSGTQFDPRVVEAFVKVIRKEGITKLVKHA